MWLIGHDRTPAPEVEAAEAAMARELAPALLTAGGASEPVLGAPQWPSLSGEIDIESVYSYRETPVEDVGLAWAATPVRPVVYLEGRYEQEADAGPGDHLLRVQTYGAFVAGASTVIFGNNPIWNFEAMPLYDYQGSWIDNLNSLGAQDAAVAWGLINDLPWARMTPDERGEFLTSGAGSGTDRAGARLSQTHAVVFIPSGRPVTLDLEKLTDNAAMTVLKVDPRSGRRSPVASSSTGTVITVPDQGRNSAGDSDWVYLVVPSS